MIEMSHAEITATLSRVSGMIEFDILHNRPVPIFMRDVDALRQAAADERRIANGELVEVVRETPRKIKPTGPKALFEKQCPKCDSLLFATDNFCGNCGAVMDEACTGKSLSGKDDNYA